METLIYEKTNRIKINKGRLEYLMERHLAGELTDEEASEFSALMQDPRNEDALKVQMDAQWNNLDDVAPPTEEQAARILANIMKLEPYPAPVMPMRRPFYGRIKRWIPAAAAAMIIVIAGLYLLKYQNESNKIDDATASIVSDIKPGGNKAVLTLANGQSIVLDTADNGQLAMLAGTTVIKLNDGQLTYNGSAQSGSKISYNTLTTPRGGQYMLVLQDGSKVWLNAGSSLRFPTAFTGKERSVELSGEAYFEVFKNAAQPFVVLANNETRVSVLGTSFNVMAYKDEVRIVTTLLEGSVNVSAINTTGDGKTIMPGQQALDDNNGMITVISNADTEQAVAWKNGKLFFNNQDIPTIMRQISRWYNVDVEIKGNIPDTYTINASRDVPIEKLLHYLEISGGVHFSIESKKIIVTP